MCTGISDGNSNSYTAKRFYFSRCLVLVLVVLLNWFGV